jgi:hypothetical protein
VATYVIEHIGDLAGEFDPGNFGADELIFVAAESDVPRLKNALNFLWAGCADMPRFLTVGEYRSFLVQSLSPDLKICGDATVNFFCGEVCDAMEADGVDVSAFADRNFTVGMFGALLAANADFSKIFWPLGEFAERMGAMATAHDMVFECAADRLLLELARARKTRSDERVIFYGFAPFDRTKMLMEAAARFHADADVIAYDFGDGAQAHLWLNTLESIFGELKFCANFTENVAHGIEFSCYETVVGEVEAALERILRILDADEHAKIGICVCNRWALQIPMFSDVLASLGLMSRDSTADHRQFQSCATIISLWAEWQISRSASAFCRFCAELLANGIISKRDFSGILSKTADLRSRCLTDNYDIILEFANLKNIHCFDLLETYDIHGRRFRFCIFAEKFTAAFGQILPSELVECIGEQGEQHIGGGTFGRDNLVKFFCNLVCSFGENLHATGENVTIVDANSLRTDAFTHLFFVAATAANFDVSEDEIWLNSSAIAEINGRMIVKSKNGENIIREGSNYLAMADSRRFLQNATFSAAEKNCHLFLSYAAKSYSSESIEQRPAKIFTDVFYKHRGQFFTNTAAAQISKNSSKLRFLLKNEAISELERCNIESCTKSYSLRHDTATKSHCYCFAIDRHSGIKISCKALEYLLKNPHIGFYDSVLRLPQMPWLGGISDKKVAIGQFTHDFLQVFEAASRFLPRVPVENFHNSIGARSKKLCTLVEKACLAADGAIPPNFSTALAAAKVMAKRLASKLETGNWRSFCSEYSLPSDVIVNFGDSEFRLSGRLDFVLSDAEAKRACAGGESATIIDFKTGGDLEMTEKNIRTHLLKYANLQLFLYGMALKSIGFSTVSIAILKPDSDRQSQAISVDYAKKCVPELIKTLETIGKTGLIERQILGKTFRQYFVDRLPLATTDLY